MVEIKEIVAIVAATIESFHNLTGMTRIESLPESFLVTYFDNSPFGIDEDVQFKPIFYRNLEDTTLFAELCLTFTIHCGGGVSANLFGSFKTNPDGVEYYEPDSYSDVSIDTQKNLYVAEAVKDDDIFSGNIVSVFNKAFIDFMNANPLIFSAKSKTEFEKKPEPAIIDNDIQF